MNNKRVKYMTTEEERERQFKQSEAVANEVMPEMSSGNRDELPPEKSKGADAQHGGPDIDKAHDRQPPQATRAHEKSWINPDKQVSEKNRPQADQ